VSASHRTIDLNADLSANVACGFHAGDPAGLARTCRAAEDLTADVVYQIGALQALAHAAGSAVSYVKPHGALYNTVVRTKTSRAPSRRRCTR
jgi:UPF0271 protein